MDIAWKIGGNSVTGKVNPLIGNDRILKIAVILNAVPVDGSIVKANIAIAWLANTNNNPPMIIGMMPFLHGNSRYLYRIILIQVNTKK